MEIRSRGLGDFAVVHMQGFVYLLSPSLLVTCLSPNRMAPDRCKLHVLSCLGGRCPQRPETCLWQHLECGLCKLRRTEDSEAQELSPAVTEGKGILSVVLVAVELLLLEGPSDPRLNEKKK